jgi:type IV pilus assembly protein PilM
MSATARNSRPHLACEITAERILAVRQSDRGKGPEHYYSRTIPRGTVTPSLTGQNVPSHEELRANISETLAAVGGRSHDVIAVLPDASVRVVLLDFDALPDRRNEAESVVRFRLKKALPFDPEKAMVSYHVQPMERGLKVIAAVALTSVVQEYETAFRNAGYNPGVVLPSMLATLGLVEGSKPRLVIKVDSETTSTAIVDRSQLLLFRTLESAPGAAVSAEQLASDIFPSLVFFQDNYGTNVEEVLVTGGGQLGELMPALEAQIDAPVRQLRPGGDDPQYAAVAGALA